MAINNRHQKSDSTGVGREEEIHTFTDGSENIAFETQTLTQKKKKTLHGPPTLTGGIQHGGAEFTMTHTMGAGTGELVDKVDWEVGDIIDGRYEVMSVLGRGGMGVVYKVNHREWKLDLAVKMPLPHLVADKTSKMRFIREAQTWVDLGLHPNIVHCWYVREFGGVPRVFMDYVGGGSLKDWITEGRVRPGDWDTILDLVIQACDGLGYAHQRGMKAHRDIKPANLLITADGDVLVTDFGIAKHGSITDSAEGTAGGRSDDRQHTTTLTGGESGTPEYSAPEQWDSASHIDARADIYALGGILFELCCGRRPFDDGSHREPPHVLIGRHLASPAPDPKEFRQDIPSCLSAIILQCLTKDPEQRPRSMTALREELTGAYTAILQKRYRRAIPRAVELHADAINNRAVSLMDLGKKAEAFNDWKEALKLEPYHPESIYNQALLEWNAGTITDDEVVRRLEHVRHIGRRANLYLGFVHLERAAANDAEREFTEALKDPVLAMSGEIWQGLGDARMAQEKFSEAEEAYNRSIQLRPEDIGNVQRQTLAQIQSRQHDNRVIFPWTHCCRIFEGTHEKEVVAVTVTPDGSCMISGDQDGTLHIWNLSTGEHLQTYQLYRKAVTAVAVTPDNNSIVLGSDDGTLWLWDRATAERTRIFEGHSKGVTAVAVGQNGRFIVSGSLDTTLRMWDATTAKSLWVGNGHKHGVTSLALTPDGYGVVSGSRDKTLRMWQLATAKCVRIFKGHTRGITAVAVMPDGRSIVSGSKDGTLWVWDIETAACVRVFKGHHGSVTAVAMTPDGRFIISGSTDRTLRLWDLTMAKCLRTFTGHDAEVNAVALTPDGRYVVSGSADTTVRLWNLDLGAQRYAATLHVCRQQNLEKIQSSTKRFRERMAWAQTAWEAGRAATAYKYLAQARTVSEYERAPEVLALNTALGKVFPRKELRGSWLLGNLEGHEKRITAVAVTPDGYFAVSASTDKTLRLWDLETRKCRRVFQGHQGAITAVAITPDGRFVVSGSNDQTLRLWNIVTAECLRIYNGHASGVTTVTTTPYGKFLISGSKDRTLRIWNPATTKCLRLLKSPGRGITAVKITPDRRSILSGCTCTNVLVWDFESGEMLRAFKGHRRGVTCTAIAPNGELAISGSADKTLRLWNISSGKCITTFHGHEDKVTSVAITPDARFAVSGSKDATWRLWNCSTGECVRSFEGHKLGITAVAMTPDARFVISGSDDRTLRLWELDWELDPRQTVDFEEQERTKTTRRSARQITSRLFGRSKKK